VLVLSLMAVHHLSRGKALAVLLIPPGLVLVLTFVGAILLMTPVSLSSLIKSYLPIFQQVSQSRAGQILNILKLSPGS
jgi:hypothetical protein